jgi:transcription initiation factor IIE alpha subunit
MAHHPFVVDLVKLVGRLFYRDEYVVVLDALTRENTIRDDGLDQYFNLPEKQVRKILLDLKSEKLVCDEDITERKEKKVRGNIDWKEIEEAVMNGPGNSLSFQKKRKRPSNNSIVQDEDDNDNDDGSSSSSDEEPGMDISGKKKDPKNREKRKITTKCWYINPRYFVDVVKYRLYCMKKHLESLQSYQGLDSMFKCCNRFCTFTCSLLEAQQRRMVVTMQASQQQQASEAGVVALGRAIETVSDPVFYADAKSSNPTSNEQKEYMFTCPLCNSQLSARHMENSSAAASKILVKYHESLMVKTGLQDLLKKLDNLRLGANRPSDLIKAKLISLHGPSGSLGNSEKDAKNASDEKKTSKSLTGSSWSDRVGGLSTGRVFSKTTTTVEVQIADEDEEGLLNTSSSLSSKHLSSVPATVSAPIAANVLPSILQKSNITGQASSTLGFVQISHGAEKQHPSAITTEISERDNPAGPSSMIAPAQVDFSAAKRQVNKPSSESKPGRSKQSNVGAYDTNINADLDAASSPAAPAVVADAGASAQTSNEALWKLLFTQLASAQPAKAAPAVSAALKKVVDENEWEDV